jgi:hypothetical protein
MMRGPRGTKQTAKTEFLGREWHNLAEVESWPYPIGLMSFICYFLLRMFSTPDAIVNVSF